MSNAGLENWKQDGPDMRNAVVSRVHEVEKNLLACGFDLSRLCYLLNDDEWLALNVERRHHEGGRHVVKIGLLTVRRA
jgi:hypothetical protein